jgi:hypothetical protein
MVSRLKTILTYYDSEPTEVTQGFIWMLFYPIIHTVECGLNLWLIIPSFLIGLASIKAACSHPVAVRKTIGLGVFLFSVVVVTYYFLCGQLPSDATHWGWVLISVSAFFNLRRLTNHYYTKHKDGCTR